MCDSVQCINKLSKNYPCDGFSKQDKLYIDATLCNHHIVIITNLRKGFFNDIKVRGQPVMALHPIIIKSIDSAHTFRILGYI